MKRVRSFAACFLVSASAALVAQQAPVTQGAAATGPDPLAVGKAAMQRRDYAAAQQFFASVAEANPRDLQATFYLANANLELKHFPDAIAECTTLLAANPKDWGAHRCLIYASALTMNWPAFDKEMALLKAAKGAGDPTLGKDDAETIDQLTVNGEEYEVRYYAHLHGAFNVRYAFLHFDSTGKADHWVQMESDDVDQYTWAKEHKKLAAAGDRAFSLDTYSNGGLNQGLIKFYFDGEPSYEAVRKDVLAVLSHKEAPVATNNTGASGEKTPK